MNFQSKTDRDMMPVGGSYISHIIGVVNNQGNGPLPLKTRGDLHNGWGGDRVKKSNRAHPMPSWVGSAKMTSLFIAMPLDCISQIS